MDDDDYGDIADEDFIEAFSQASQTLPPHPAKRRKDPGAMRTTIRRRRSRNTKFILPIRKYRQLE